jgi:hypothetical protein
MAENVGSKKDGKRLVLYKTNLGKKEFFVREEKEKILLGFLFGEGF